MLSPNVTADSVSLIVKKDFVHLNSALQAYNIRRSSFYKGDHKNLVIWVRHFGVNWNHPYIK